ncbi:PREDICTED: protocadherin alpha-9-like [Dipodomys ordii]|uniref:Protocadherin alpha-9-like n=1 Tax=Dipodomys ordii TaxID=10020 RepID=A0A1S3FGM8_DIPOR|nr:PREDICTED: protocadherin alpha-9-like [Dipodomys ordii]
MVYVREHKLESRQLLFMIIIAAWRAGSGQLHYSVPEEAKHGTFVGRIAQDLGLELTELVPRLFRVASKGRGDLLEVNLQNGILFVNGRIDREELCGRSAECSLHLEVIVDRPLQVFHVEVEVKDINDNAPVFPATQKNLFIPESRLLDSRLPLEGASDADIGANALLTYRLSPSEYFSLDVPPNHEQVKPLELVLRKPLDREEAPELYLWLTATDGGKPELTGTVQFLITVLDANDNAPVFDRTLYTAKLPENVPIGTMVTHLNASDLDEGVNGEITYSFSSNVSPEIKSKFHIDSVSGEITVIGLIDFEERKVYNIQVEASDRGLPPLAGHCTVLVQVVDINDNAPQLTLTSLALPISEDTQPGTVVTLINVFDRDSGNNGQVTCSLTPDTPFTLVSTFKNYYSLILESTLDRETESTYELVVTARDRGSPPLWATASVSVEVADVNDNAPVFAQAEYEGACAPGKPVLVCSSAVGSWSYSQQRRQRVCSGEGPPKTDLMAFSPSLPHGPTSADNAGSGQLHYSVREEAKHGTFVGRIAQDLGLELTELVPRLFRVASKGRGDLLEKNPSPFPWEAGSILFHSVTNNGEPRRVKLRQEDDFSEFRGNIHQLKKDLALEMVFSGGTNLESVNLLFSLLLFTLWEAGSGQLHYSVPEEAKHGTFVGRIAQDLGLELTELVPRLFQLDTKGGGDLLEVNLQNGILFVNGRIDREELCGRSAECSLHLEVIVDRPLQVFHVEVEVKDINDNPPVFPVNVQKLFISESRTLDSRFLLEGASDADFGANSVLTYVLDSNDYFTLSVNSKNKENKQVELVLRKSLDREEAPEHSLLLMATDGGKPELTGSLQLLVTVLDVNDNAPSFEQSEYEVRIFENADNGTMVIRVNASDRDEGTNGAISYSEGACAPGKPVLVCSSAVGSLTYSQQRRQRVCSAVGPPKTDLMAFSPSLPPCPGSADGVGEPSTFLDSSGKGIVKHEHKKIQEVGTE